MITKKDVEHIALLSRLDLTEEEKDKLVNQLGQILEHAGKIASLDTSKVEPTSHAVETKNVLRKDVKGPSLSQEEALSNAPEIEEGSFVVPKIV
ncbi:MAG: Asp-tRNA(Asn)/Glu-tRNA(Gln) amidotransferase subunit GatC [Actinobacteria bacterium]|nr:MAG: Asp-tRNA(Asn)/Glu-tRNA(Gln) amidotransferase subunit GatC [Actinomycetota bacterium]